MLSKLYVIAKNFYDYSFDYLKHFLNLNMFDHILPLH